MYRFFCTICQRIKRVQRPPRILVADANQVMPEYRAGECNKHNLPAGTPLRPRRVRVTRIKKVLAPPTPPKAGKKGKKGQKGGR